MKNFAVKLSSAVKSPEVQHQIALACAQAYALDTGGTFTAFEIDSNDCKINLAGLAAVIPLIGLVRRPLETHEGALKRIAAGKLSDNEWSAATRMANATWMAQQPFRADGDKPLGRSDRFNVFDGLSVTEKQKDRVQIRAAATELYQQLKKL